MGWASYVGPALLIIGLPLFVLNTLMGWHLREAE